MNIDKILVAILAPPASGKRAAVSLPQCTKLKLDIVTLAGPMLSIVTEHTWPAVLNPIYLALRRRYGVTWRYNYMLDNERYPLTPEMLTVKRALIGQNLRLPSGSVLAVIGDIDVFFALQRLGSNPANVASGTLFTFIVMLPDFPVHQNAMAKKCSKPWNKKSLFGKGLCVEDPELGQLRERYLAMAKASNTPVAMGWPLAFRMASDSLARHAELQGTV